MSVAVVAIFSLMLGQSPAAGAASQTFDASRECQYRVSGFQDWGKAAASNRDLLQCTYLRVQLSYGGPTYGWTTSAGPTLNNYLKVNAGYYDWKAAWGSVSNDGYVWRGICNSPYC